jgi:RHS repeat-associated protein
VGQDSPQAASADNDVTSQTINGTTTSYGYNLGQLETATTGGTIDNYNYDPLGRLDTVTSVLPGSATPTTLQSNTYDGFDNLTATSQLNTSTGSMDTTTYNYDSLNRVTSETTAAGTSSYTYLGLSSDLVTESDPGGESKSYDYTPGGQRLSQDVTGGSGPAGYGYYSYNSHDDVEAVTGTSGNTMATYGYTAYGDPIASMFTGADQNDATASPTSTSTPYNSYRFNAMRWDSSSGSYDMGFRNYDPSLNQFASRDMYDGALDNMGLTTDPFTGSQYAFGAGNPVTNIENNGHSMLTPGGGGAPSSASSCLGPVMSCGPDYTNVPAGQQNPGTTASPSSGSSGSSSSSGDSGFWGKAGDLLGGALTGIKDTVTSGACALGSLGGQMVGAMPTGVTSSGQFLFTNSSANLFSGPCSAHIGNSSSVAYKVGYYGWPLLFPPAEGEDDAATIISQVAQEQSDQGISHLLNFLSQDQQAQYLANPAGGSRFLGTAVHLATRDELNSLYPGRFLYRTVGPDFVDTTTGETIELTTPGQYAAHVARGGPYPYTSYAFYTLP